MNFFSVFGRDCSEVEADPKADPFDKEICHSFRMFEDNITDLFSPAPQVPRDDQPPLEDPQSLRDSILSRPQTPLTTQKHNPGNHRHHVDNDEDKGTNLLLKTDLDNEYKKDPSILLDGVLRGNTSVARQPTREPHLHSYHSSVSVTTIRKPDGTVEEHKTVKDSRGNEQTTVTMTMPENRSTEVDKKSTILDWIRPWPWK